MANSGAELDLPHRKGWTSRGLTIGCYLLWQMLGYSFICHTKMEFVWQTAVQSQICHTTGLEELAAEGYGAGTTGCLKEKGK